MPTNDVLAVLSMPTLPAIVIHGGAWVRDGADSPPLIAGLERAAAGGFAVLAAGGSAVEAVEAAVVLLEDDPLFNAGRGSCLTADGTIEMDASIMDGRSLDAGAVAAVRGVRNPVRLARRVMTDSGHLLLVGDGAERYAREAGETMVASDWHVTDEQHRRYLELAEEAARTGTIDRRKLGTVGAVAVDVRGHVAAATSTGGTAFKRPGRVGDSPLIGCGTYADDATGAVSCTGHGESITRLTLARWACDAAGRLGALEAANAASTLLRERVGGDGGLIVVTPDGRAGWAMNTPKMSRAVMRAGLDKPIALL